MTKEQQRIQNKRYYQEHKEEIKSRMRKYHWSHKKERNEKCRQWHRNKFKTDPEYRKKYREKQKEHYWKKRAYYLAKSKIASKTIAHKARIMVNSKVRWGTIIRPKSCEICKKRCKPVAHHFMGYENPFKIMWICNACHGEIHRKY